MEYKFSFDGKEYCLNEEKLDYLVNDEQYYECVNCGSLLDYIENSKYITVNKRADVVVVE